MQNLIVKTNLETEHLELLSRIGAPTSFADKPTCSTGKNDTELYHDTLTGPILRALNIDNEFQCAVLLGHPKGAKRQIERWIKLGFSERNIVIFEWCPILARKIKAWVKRHGYECQVIACDLIKGVEVLSSVGYRFSYIEFDSVEIFGTREPLLYRIVKRLNIPVLITQGSSRGQASWFKVRAEKLGAKTYLNHGYKCFDLKDSADKIIGRALTGYDSHLITYGGRESVNKVTGKNQAAPMYLAISIKAA